MYINMKQRAHLQDYKRMLHKENQIYDLSDLITRNNTDRSKYTVNTKERT